MTQVNIRKKQHEATVTMQGEKNKLNKQTKIPIYSNNRQHCIHETGTQYYKKNSLRGQKRALKN